MAGEIWLELDRLEGISFDELIKRLENRDRPKDLLLMAFGWLVYQGHVKYVPVKNGGRLFLVSPTVKEGFKNEKSDQNNFVISNA